MKLRKMSFVLLSMCFFQGIACGKKTDCSNPTTLAIKNSAGDTISVTVTSGTKSATFNNIAASTTAPTQDISFSNLKTIPLTVTSGTAIAGPITLVAGSNNTVSVFADTTPTVAVTAGECGGSTSGGFW